MVPGAGLEPARGDAPRDFESFCLISPHLDTQPKMKVKEKL